MKFASASSEFSYECVPKTFDLIGILADRCNCSYVLGQILYRIHVIDRATTTEFGGLAFTVV
ncbi:MULTISPECIES: hypothetical protein [Leptospira]|uniref:hypothetical protein n=1 Tax=Leptospira TaxID=171 RepID=UPI00097BF99D|nr:MULTISPECIES: hypothetical protein [Leptospira]MBF3373909.1 hypothetical protein [Leptospira borgpetersenii serovar Arborea]AXX15341.1 hypothetical protein C4Q31_07115 [Leptospira borgpetersenii serovar Ceylonica]MBE8160802.1 hypothetical protein [Leptospira borgpetersenii serovar Ballum]MBE8165135.1 hypothetical protein [Leptospira borgpetersenii serovar Ballum]MBE8170639.1 hypothetical protein [Leptospira borgpetersenii serovar Ballum]